MTADVPLDAGRDLQWDRTTIAVAGVGIAGAAAAHALLGLGARVVVLDESSDPRVQSRVAELAAAGAEVELGPGAVLPDAIDLVVTSPGLRPDRPLLLAAAARGVPIWGDVELAWRIRPADQPWLAITGTNGKTTTVRMLAAMLTAAGLRATSAGNVGTPLTDVVLDPTPYQVLAVELSSFQLHWTQTVRARAAAVLNVAPDHLDWHGSFDAYAAAKGRIYRGASCSVFNADDFQSTRFASPQPRRIGFTLAEPAAGQVGLAAGFLVDRIDGDRVDLAPVEDVQPAAPHNVANALAAAALARSFGLEAAAVRDGLRAFRPDPHRIAHVRSIDGVDYVDDSKATNPHAAAASLAAYPSVVWIAGGLAKGATFDDLVRDAAPRLRAVVLLGRDRDVIRAALGRHAAQVPVVDVVESQTGQVTAMDDVVRAAAQLARPGDTVLLAPACASMDMFTDYRARGDAFAAAVHRVPATPMITKDIAGYSTGNLS